jgi:diguanylate cyclase (GGDEF)-like protein
MRHPSLPTIGLMATGTQTHVDPALDPLERVAAVVRESLPTPASDELIARIQAELAGALPPDDWEELAAENARLRHELELLSGTDSLTGMRNRHRFFEDLKREFASARRHHDSLALLVVHVDGLAQVNATHGFEAGDALLIAVSETILRSIRVTDTAARLGDDDFAIVLTRATHEGADKVAERLSDASEAPLRIGVAETTEDVTSSGDLLERAYRTLADRRRSTR